MHVADSRWSSPKVVAVSLASSMVLPAVAPVIDAVRMSSPALLFVGFIFLIGLGVPYYLLLYMLLKEEIASSAESQHYLTGRQRPVAAKTAVRLQEWHWSRAPGA
jgi:uncharacterized membrane protein YdfJ with MMPL/SSD domain